ncbi:bi-domain-containing oxidoreductase [Spirosoma utsteinense]|uniref:Dehydrogenase/threonine dehydrogenase-like Zn-dependent dehydrogenase n=1 Tax=Spirosoma utsteinense TaxID=2585773 RepID=A0ABR6W6Q7_9BACT|nr:bi-domain-containing oxidoreductase [Spirosoma utsteinense]MBC3786086.1 putative dehydrogenase/threonine dehydrogenase-like Zn-dependent dehydrogenase [Spirosoma utsteinense]MBC3792275.1 putative dehydrogenase/threonine dehydrogenase-like Zn-dependent dehydrogenase [Spirosoma utsteinense]
MKQLVQNLKTGETLLDDVPVPQVGRGQVLIRTTRSLVSPGTERMLVEFGRASLIAKARQQPDKVRQVLEKIRADGVIPTVEAVFRKLGQPIPLGYCNVGTVLAVGEGVIDLRIGDRVTSNGAHAEVVCVPRNLVALIPEGVSDDEAAFTVVGAIALQGLRLLNPTLGETVVVAGLGLLGLLTAELLRINGCHVIGLDIDETRLELARQRGVLTLNPTVMDDVAAVFSLTNGVGADGVIISASAKQDQLVSQAARMSRKRGRIVLVGVVDLNLNRAEFYEKELSFQVSCSYGPGRYDDAYEQQGHDYPLPFVRWTENRNFQTVLGLLSTGQLAVASLITEVVPFMMFNAIYSNISQSTAVASMLHYAETVSLQPVIAFGEARYRNGTGTVGLIGAGNFMGATLLPALKAAGANLKIIASATGLKATLLARKFGVARSTTDYAQLLNDPDIDLCVIATRHDSHARLTVEALRAGKHVFVEKPLAIHDGELAAIIDAQQVSGRMVMVGFNRRFSPHVQKMKALLGGSLSGEIPMNVVITVNAGSVPAGSWVNDRLTGGGRILGEVCHFVDLITCLTGRCVGSVCLNAMGENPTETTDSASLLLRYDNGSTGVINYFANGHRAYAKERVEVYSQGRTLVLDNFRKLTGYGFNGFSSLSGRQNKGHAELMSQLIGQLRNEQSVAPLIPFAEIINTTQTTLAALHSLRESRWVRVGGIAVTSLSPPGCEPV